MKKLLLALLPLAGCVAPQRVTVAPAVAVVDAADSAPANNPLVAGTVMPTDRTIAAAVAAVPGFAILHRAIVAGSFGATLAAAGPMTLFAPTDEAFGRLAPGTVDALVQPENRDSLGKLLRLHLVPGRLTSAALLRLIAAGGGRATLTTVGGELLTLSLTGAVVTLTDAGGNRSYVETADVRQTNGVLHVVNGVLVPRLDRAPTPRP
ncbi:fasciclin domain-containing protein [Sphingomonas sp.]|uniref:fasciclin domain-containing protein n=1 Tax=Sphingomonas sp. TaxID=28214 RepID=UPI003B00153C